MAAKQDRSQAAIEVTQLKEVILWARKEQIAITHLTVGSITLVMHDSKLTAAMVERGTRGAEEAEKPRGIYADFGGALMNPPQSEGVAANEPTIEDDDE